MTDETATAPALPTHKKKRIEIIIEAPILNRLLDALDRAGVKGYTVLPALAGRGRRGRWSRDGLVSGTGQSVMILAIVDPSQVSAVLEPVFRIVERQIGIVTVSDVEVVRADHF